MVETAAQIWRDYVLDGVPASGVKEPEKSKIREWGTNVEETLNTEIPALSLEIDSVEASIDNINISLTTVSGQANSANIAAQAALDAVTAGIKPPKQEVRILMTTNVVIASALENGDTLDSLVLATGDRVALTGQTAPAENGIYVVQASGAAVRATDMDTSDEIIRATFSVSAGSKAGETWSVQNTAAITVGTTAITIVKTQSSNALNSEVITARSGKASLDTRIDEVDATALFAAGGYPLLAESGVHIDLAGQIYHARSITTPSQNEAGALGSKISTVRSTTKFVTTVAGILSSVAINTNAFEYAGQGNRPLGMSVFPASESRIHYSNVLGLWTPTGLTVTAAASTGPDGVANATRLTPDGSNGAHRTYPTASLVAAVGAWRCFSVYVKRPSGSANARISSAYATGKSVNVDYNLTTGERTVTGGQARHGAQRLANGWWRIWMAHVSDYDFMQPTLVVLDSSMAFTHAGTDPLDAVKARADAGRSPIYPIEFNNTTLYGTTGDDRPVFTLTGTPAAVTSSGTIIIEAEASEDGLDYERVLAQIDTGSDNSAMRITNGPAGIGTLRAQVISSGTAISTSGVGPANCASAPFKVALSWSASGYQFSVNGTEIGEYTATIPGPVFTTLRIGHRAAGDRQWWGNIKSIQIVPRRMTMREIWSAESAIKEPIVLVASGQSNMYGARTGGDLTPSDGVYAWNPDTSEFQVADLESKPFGPGYGAPTGSNNLAFHAAKRIYEQTGRRVYIILDARAGQPIRKWCKAGERPYRDTLFATVVSALASLGRSSIDGFLWHQGEGDSQYLRLVGTLGATDADARPEHASEHLYRGGLLSFATDIRAQTWADETTPFLVGELVQGGLSGVSTTDDRNDVLSNISRYGAKMYCVPSYGLPTDGTLHHFDGLGLQYFGYRYADVFLGIHPGNNHNPNDDKIWRRREEITTNVDAVPVYASMRNVLYWSRSASARSLTLEPLLHGITGIVTVANLGGGGNLTIKPGTSRIFDIGGTLNPASLVLSGGQKAVLECVSDSAPGTAQAWQVLP